MVDPILKLVCPTKTELVSIDPVRIKAQLMICGMYYLFKELMIKAAPIIIILIIIWIIIKKPWRKTKKWKNKKK